MQYVTLEDTVYFWFASNDTSGSGNDGASAVYDVREGGASSSAAPTLSGSATLLSDAGYPDGCYEVAIAATSGNGFSASKTYGVFCTLAVDSQNPTGLVGVFRTAPVPANVTQFGGSAGTFSGGRPEVNTTHAAGTAWNSGAIGAGTIGTDAFDADALATDAVQEIRNAITGGAYALDTDANGRVRIVDGTGVGEINTNAGAIALVDLVTDITTKTGYSLSAAGVTAVWNEYLIDPSIPITGRSALLLASSSGLGSFSVDDVSATTTSFVTDLTSTVDDFYADMQLTFTSGALTGQIRVISSYDQATKTITLDEALTSAPANNDTFVVSGPHTHTKTQIADAVWDEATSGHSTAGSFGKALTDALANTVSIETDTQDIQSRLPAALVSGRMDAYIGAAGTDTITAAALAADAAQEIRNAITGGAYPLDTDANGRVRVVDGTGAGELSLTSGLIDGITGTKNTFDSLNDITAASVWAAATRTLTAIDEDSTTLDLDATIRAAVGMASANLDTQLDALPTAAEINAEVVDALNTDTYAEPGQGAPGATITLAAKIGYLYKAWRNKKDQTSSLYQLYADNESTVDQKATITEVGSTTTLGEMATGA